MQTSVVVSVVVYNTRAAFRPFVMEVKVLEESCREMARISVGNVSRADGIVRLRLASLPVCYRHNMLHVSNCAGIVPALHVSCAVAIENMVCSSVLPLVALGIPLLECKPSRRKNDPNGRQSVSNP